MANFVIGGTGQRISIEAKSAQMVEQDGRYFINVEIDIRSAENQAPAFRLLHAWSFQHYNLLKHA